MTREILASPDAAQARAADLVVEAVREAVAARGRAALCLAGGHTPARTYDLLAEAPRRDRIDWRRVYVTFGDERIVPAFSPLSNARMAREHLTDRVPLLAERLIAFDTGRGIESPAALARRHEWRLRRLARELGDAGPEPVFDLCLLGMGAEGHTASLFPGSAGLGPAGQSRMVLAVTAPADPPLRLTLTPRVLSRSRRVVFLVCGADKAAAVAAALTGTAAPEDCPTRAVAPPSPPVWLLDAAAASALP
jgi:6-phosphogluconolactonase